MSFVIQADPGDLVPIVASIYHNGILIDPPIVAAHVKNAVGTITTYTAGVSPEFVQTGTGLYRLSVSIPYAVWTIGQWPVTFQASLDSSTSVDVEPAVITVNNPRTF